MKRTKLGSIALFISFFFTVNNASAQTITDYQINAPLLSGSFESIMSPRFSANGEEVVYEVVRFGFGGVDGVVGDFVRLHRATTLSSGSETRVGPNLPESISFSNLIADENLDRAGILLPNVADPANLEFFSVPLNGEDAVLVSERVGGLGSQIRLNNQESEFFFNARVSPNDPNNPVIGLLRTETNANGPNLRVDTQPGIDMNFVDFDFSLTNNDSHAVYTSNGVELYAADLNSGDAERLDTDGINVVAGRSGVTRYLISNSAMRVAYLAPVNSSNNNGFVDFDFELFSTNLDGSGHTQLSAAGAIVRNFFLNSDEDKVVYLADEEATGVFEIFATSVDSGPTVKVNSTLGTNEEINEISGFRTSQNGGFVSYVVRNTVTNQSKVFIAELSNLSNSFELAGIPNSFADLSFSSQGDQVAFATETNNSAIQTTLHVGDPSTGSFSQFILPDGVAEVQQLSFMDNDSLLFVARDSSQGSFDQRLYAYSLSERQLLRLSRPVAIGGRGVTQYWFLENSNRIAYLGDMNTAFQQDLFALDTSQIEFESSEFCFPIIPESGGAAVVCL